ncbi:monooxygenase-like protein [Leptodontidium sp. MPI-SDFR-AT-0119]|nr:monooxygenase-like protein [Leptodontidium sp. MPI-SDFR-AT-0119]
MADLPVLIIGAGVVGLVLAQALKKEGIPFLIFDRDEYIDARSHGWGITIHWALPALKQCLPTELFDRLKTIQVDPEQGRNDTGQFLFLNLANAEPVFQIPPAPRLRIHREKFRKLLLEGIDVRWSKKFEGFDAKEDFVEVKFEGGSKAQGSLLVGCDGATSKLRRVLCPETGALDQLPIRFLGVTVKLLTKDMTPLRSIDPLLFQGCYPDTGAYMWFATLDTPEVNKSQGADEYYTAQLNISWPVRSPADEVPASNADKLKKMKFLASNFEERLKFAVHNIPEDTEVTEVKLADWPCLEWPNSDGKVTLLGDAAHAMTMYRGEAANHGITDAQQLYENLLRVGRGEISQKIAVDHCEAEMRGRTSWAVTMSRQACLDAHDFKSLNKDSAILARRVVKS